MKKYCQRYIYEMVTFRAWESNEPSSFYIDYHFEDYFTNRKAAIAYVQDYIEWLKREKMAKKVVDVNLNNKYGSQTVMYRIENKSVIEYYGIVRNRILN